MLRAGADRGPGISWIGQFFVPLGLVIGSIDKALLLSLTLAQTLSLFLLYVAVLRLERSRIAVASLSVMSAAATPLFVGLGHLYLVESFQVLAVSWFVFILASANLWPRAFIIGQLLAAGAFAILMKATTPCYCLLLGLAALGYAARPDRPWGLRDMKTKVVLGVALLLSLAVLFWYKQNFVAVVQHSRIAASGPIAALWGKEDTVLNTLGYWLGQIQPNFFLPAVLVGSCVLVVLALPTLRPRLLASNPDLVRPAVCAGAALLQILGSLLLFSFGANRVGRFLLPILPCMALLISWASARLGKGKIVPWLALSLYLGQFILVHGQVLGLIAPNRSITGFLWQRHRDKVGVELADEIVARTCIYRRGENTYLNILAIAPELKGDWLGPAPARYAVAKRFGRRIPCEYAYAGSSFFGADIETTWQEVLRLQPHYIITNDPTIYPSPKNSINRSVSLESHHALLSQIRNSGLFMIDGPMRADPGFITFRRRD